MVCSVIHMMDKKLSSLILIVWLMLFAIQVGADDSLSKTLSDCKSLEDDQPQQAIALAEPALSSELKISNPFMYGHILGCATWAYAVNNQSDVAQNNAIEMEVLIRQLDDTEDKVDLLRRTGSIFHRIGNRIAAVDNYQLAMNLAETLELKKAQIPILINLGVLNSQIREHEQAVNNYTLALDLMDELDDDQFRAPVLFNLALTLNGQGYYQKSLPLLQQVESMMTDKWPKSRSAQVFTGLASAYISLESFNQAQSYVEKALALFSTESSQSIEYYVAKVVHAEILIALGQSEAALENADTAWQFYQAKGNREQVLSVNNPLYALAAVYEDLNKPYKALAVRKLSAEIDQAFQDSFNKEAMAQMQARLSDSQQRKQLAELKTEQAKSQIELIAVQHNRQLIILLVAFASAVVLVFFYWQRLINKRLHAISLRDSLTQLGNRRAIQEWIAHRKFPLSPKVRLMWLIDLDLFKDINDRYGHETGDDVLIKMSSTLIDFTNEHRFVGRWGGEEFMFITDDVSEAAMSDFCDELRIAIADTIINYQGKKISVTASIGVCRLEGVDKKAWHKALNAADKALYQAKDKGRNCMVCGE